MRQLSASEWSTGALTVPAEHALHEPGEVVRQLPLALAELVEEHVDVALVHAEVCSENRGGRYGEQR